MNQYIFLGITFSFIMGVIGLLEYGSRKGWSWIYTGKDDATDTMGADGSAAACGDGVACM